MLSDPDSGPNVARIDAGLATLAAQSEGAKATAVRDEWGHKPERTDPGNLGFGAGWAGLNLDDSQWPVINLPTPWQLAGHSCSGVFWFRREINLPAVCVGKELILHLGALMESKWGRLALRRRITGKCPGFTGFPVTLFKRVEI